MGYDVSALVQPPTLGHGPELIEALRVELHLRLLPGEARAALRGEDEILAAAAQAHLPVGANRQITLLDLIAGGPIQIRRSDTRNLRSTSMPTS
jgi:hypothetical protein